MEPPIPIMPGVPAHNQQLQSVSGLRHQPTTQGLEICSHSGGPNQRPRPSFVTPTPTPSGRKIHPLMQAPAVQDLTAPLKFPDPDKPLISIQEGTDKIVGLLVDETEKMRTYFSGLLLGTQQQLVRERDEKEYLWRRVQELEGELRSLKSLHVGQKEDYPQGKK